MIVLEESSVLLDEVVAIGYGKQSRALITNSISKINKEEFQKAPGQNPLLQLQGKVPGLSLQISNGQPGADLKYLFVEVVLLHLKVILLNNY